MEIPQELTDFQTAVSPSIDDMSAKVSKLVEKIDQLKLFVTEFESGIDSLYSSKNKQTILSSITSLSSAYTSIGTSISGTLKQMVDGASEIVKLVNTLSEIDGQISAKENEILVEKRKEEPSQSFINTKNSEISSLKNEFETNKNNAVDKLSALKSLSDALEEAPELNSGKEYENLVTSGQFVECEFTSSKGVKISYYLYIPNVEDITNLPINMYLNGGYEFGNVLGGGLPKQLSDGTVTPSGIVICPHTRSDSYYYKDDYREALVELTADVAKTYKADTNRISLSGHSCGAITAYNLVKMYPNYFSAIVAISGGEFLSDADAAAFENVSVWAFHGDRDPNTQRASYKNVKNRTIGVLADNDVDAFLTTLEGQGHNTQNNVFTNKYYDANGNLINPLEWAFLQSKA